MNKQYNNILIFSIDNEIEKKIKEHDFLRNTLTITSEEGFHVEMVPDIVIVDFGIRNMDLISVLEYALKCKKDFDSKTIVATPISSVIIMSEYRKYKIDFVFNNIKEIKYLIAHLDNMKIHDQIEHQEENDYGKIFNEIVSVLREDGIRPNLVGYKYLLYGIELCLNDNDLIFQVTKRLYPMIAVKYNTNAYCVERNMRHALSHRQFRPNALMLNETSRHYDEGPHVSNSEYMGLTVEKIKYRRYSNSPFKFSL